MTKNILLTGQQEYPEDVIEEIETATGRVVELDASQKAQELGTIKAANVILLGALVQAMELEHIDWDGIICSNVKEAFVNLNLKAIKAGMAAV